MQRPLLLLLVLLLVGSVVVTAFGPQHLPPTRLCHPTDLWGSGVALMTLVSSNTTTVFGEPGELILS